MGEHLLVDTLQHTLVFLWGGNRLTRSIFFPVDRHAYDPALLSSWNLPLDGETTSRDAQPSDEVQQRPVASAGPTAAASALQGAGVDSRTGIKKNIWIRDLLLENNGET